MNRETVIRKERKMKELLNKADTLLILDENQKKNRDNQNELLRDNNSFASILKCFASCFYSGYAPLRDLEINDFTLITQEEEKCLDYNKRDIEDYKETVRSVYHKLNSECVLKTDGISIFACTNVNSDYENVYKKANLYRSLGLCISRKKNGERIPLLIIPLNWGFTPVK